MLGRSAGTPTALWCSARGRAAELTSLTSFRFVLTAAASQFTKRALRAATSPVLLSVSEARVLPERAFVGTLQKMLANVRKHDF